MIDRKAAKVLRRRARKQKEQAHFHRLANRKEIVFEKPVVQADLTTRREEAGQ